MLQVCLNGARRRAQCPWLPISPRDLAEAAREAVEAGADEIHLHPKTPDGADSLDGAVVAEALDHVRAAAPGVPVGVTTGAWAEPDARARARRVRSWRVTPDYASVNWHEDGAEEVAEALREQGVGVEAGLWSGTGSAARFRAWRHAGEVVRVLAEVVDRDPATAAGTALALLEEIGGGRVPVLLHGEDGGAWPVLRTAAELGLDTRVGLEDVLHHPDGSLATDNAGLVRSAKRVMRSVIVR